MESKAAVRALGSLAHVTRLAIFRLLVQAGEAGLAVGSIGEQLKLAPATLSFHLAGLRHAGLVTARRDGRTIYHAANYTEMNVLIGYLSDNCCQGEVCAVDVRKPATKSRPSRIRTRR